MSPEMLLEQFDAVAEAPGGVQRLRELILQLAVRGKLVPQDPGDEPASVLLERIEAEKQRLFENGKISRPKELPPIEPCEAPFELPEGWGWVRIGSAMELINGRAFKPAEWACQGLPIVRIQNLNDESAPFNCCDFEVRERFRIHDEDLLISWSGTPGTSFGAFVWRRGPAVLNQHIFRCELFAKALENDFARIAVNARLDEMIDQAHGGVGLRHITKAKLEKLAIVLPPLPEQRRIVEKVDQFMSLCDEVEERQRQRVQKRDRLNRAALHKLTTAADDGELTLSWERIRENIEVLYDAPETVAELRQAILQLAVRGKLVPQDPDDEPASGLLERIQAEKRRLHGAGKISESPELSPIIAGEQPFEMPKGWQWGRFGQITEVTGGVTKGRKLAGRVTAKYPYLRVANVQRGALDLGVVKEIEIPIDEVDRYRLEPGDILMTEGGDWDKVGRAAIWNGEIAVCLHQNHVFRARPYPTGPLAMWLALQANSPDGRGYFQSASKQTTNLASINMTQLRAWPCAVPPLSEQRRIVEKVAQLMSLCDELETKLARARSKSEHLAAAVVHHLTAA